MKVNAAMGIKTKLNPEGKKTFSQDVLKIEKCGPTEDYAGAPCVEVGITAADDALCRKQ